ncbi:MAG: PRC-barrel domain-containing protein [Rhodobacterales bacterium]
MSTAIVALTSLPVTAQITDNVQTGDAAQSGQAQTQMQGQLQAQMELRENVEAADLIGKRIFMSRQAARQQGQETDQPASEAGTSTGTGGVQVPPQAGGGTDAQPGTEQDLATETQLDQNGTDGMQVTPPTADGTDARPGTRQDLATQTQLDQSGSMSGSGEDRPRMVGVITDVILNADGDAVGLVIDAGGYLGIAANEIRLPMEDVSFVPDHQLGLQPMGQQEAASAQEPVAFSVVYIGDPAAFQLSENFDEAQSAELGETRGSASWGQPEQDWQEISISAVTPDELLGAPVYGSQNEWIAQISELSLDQNVQVENVIVDVGGFLGTGTKPVALPIEDVQLRVYGGTELRAYIPYTEVQLDDMEAWESDSDL